MRIDQELRERNLPVCTADEFPSYVWADSKTKEEPVKEYDHGMDAKRYLVAHRDLGVRSRIRWIGGEG